MPGPLTVTRFSLLPEPRPMGGEQVLATATVTHSALRQEVLVYLLRRADGTMRVWWTRHSKFRWTLETMAQVSGIESALGAAYEDERINIEEQS